MESSKRAQGEVLVPLKTVNGRVPPVTQVRSTLLASSVQTLRDKGLLDGYLAALPKEKHGSILEAVAGSWIPIDVAMAHYGACDALSLQPHEVFENGRAVSQRVQSTMLGLLARTAKNVGMTPWTGLEQFQKMWDRVMVGGSGAVYRIGPKEARVESHGNPLVKHAYYRNSWRGVFAGTGELFAEKLYVTDVTPPRGIESSFFVLRVAWV